jgi:hypothetical protein
MDKRLLDTFKNLIVGNIYSSSELDTMLKGNRLSGNIAGISVNRWNRGMTTRDFNSILFEFINIGQYIYLGPNHNYTGPSFWYGHGRKPIGIIGNWKDGEFTFSIEGINNFNEWKRNRFPYTPIN